ncbi:CRISPR-associated protein, Csd1 family [hydrothermal vent metagenome]|uniref:CRISPR-associated protein, Csd1 family n=1 Tax=hydrothermal vent metagenome TaxID=652676 RepID=A0A3B1D052_9ZZZZ
MILQSLISLYERLAKEDNVPPFGFSLEGIGFCIVISKEGDLIGDPQDLRTPIKANVFEFFESVVPYSNKVNVRSSGAANTPNFMVDKADFIFGMSDNLSKEKHHASFKSLIDEVTLDSDDEGIMAVKKFLQKWNPKDFVNLKYWKDICGTHGKWVAFQLEGERGFVHERLAVKNLWSSFVKKIEYSEGVNFIDGKKVQLQNQYAQFKFGSGGSLVSFNESAYESYNKKRGKNAPISVESEFKSSTALKYLLRSKTQRLRIGDAVTVFWTENNSPAEEFFGMIFNPHDDETNSQLEQYLKAVRKGARPEIPDYDGDVKFCILGLSLNKARLAVRFWYSSTLEILEKNIGKHFQHLEMERQWDKDPLNPGVWHLLKETARETKGISPLLGGALMRSILEGIPYPKNFFNGVLNRIRADQRINYLRAAICKAVLIRNHNMEVSMSLDTEKKDIAYLLGRLFAVLEKAQQDAIPGANATIKDRFYGTASACPASVFPRLLRLAQHHISKAEYGYVSDKRIAEIMEGVEKFPAHMDLQEQGIFAIAYYQQRNALYKKKDSSKDINKTEEEQS